MQAPYDWYAPAHTYQPNDLGGRTYPSPAPSIDPSPGPLPHLTLQEPFAHHNRMSVAYGRRQLEVDDAAARFPEQRDMQHPYHTHSPSTSMASPYSPYPPRNIDALLDEARIPSPALSSGSGSGSGSGSVSGSARSPLSAGASEDASYPRAQSSSMPPRRIQKHTKHRLLAADRKAICLYHLNAKHARQEDIASRFGCERSTVSKILKHKDKWLNISTATEASNSAKSRGSKFPIIEARLSEHYLFKWYNNNTVITDQLLRTTALQIVKDEDLGLTNFKASSGWLENFKHRYKIRRGEWLEGPMRNKIKYGTEAPTQQPYPTPDNPHAPVPLDEQVEVYNSLRPSHNNNSLSLEPPIDPPSPGPSFAELMKRSTQGENGEELLSVSDIILQNAPPDYGKRLYPLFLPAEDARERWEQLKAGQHQASFSLEHIMDSADKLASFFDNEGRGILKPAEKRVLEHIRSALMHLSMGYDWQR